MWLVIEFLTSGYLLWVLRTRCGSRHLHKGGGGAFFVFFYRKYSDFKAIWLKTNKKIPRRNSKRKLQTMVKRKMTKLEIFCKNTCLPVYNLAKKKGGPLSPPPGSANAPSFFFSLFFYDIFNVVGSVFVVGRQGLYLFVCWITIG